MTQREAAMIARCLLVDLLPYLEYQATLAADRRKAEWKTFLRRATAIYPHLPGTYNVKPART